MSEPRAGEDPPLDFPPPGREHTALSALPVALGGSGRGMLESAMLAEVALAAAPEAGAEGLTLTLPRCACTLTLCDTPDAWSCGVCTRRWVSPILIPDVLILRGGERDSVAVSL